MPLSIVIYCSDPLSCYRNVTFAEPYVLLSQIYWGHEYGGDGQHVEKAKHYLRKVVDIKSAKREFWSNLGLLMFATERNGTPTHVLVTDTAWMIDVGMLSLTQIQWR